MLSNNNVLSFNEYRTPDKLFVTCCKCQIMSKVMLNIMSTTPWVSSYFLSSVERLGMYVKVVLKKNPTSLKSEI